MYKEARGLEVPNLLVAAKGGFNAVEFVTVPRFPPANTNKHTISSELVNKGKTKINQYFLHFTHLEYLQMIFQKKQIAPGIT